MVAERLGPDSNDPEVEALVDHLRTVAGDAPPPPPGYGTGISAPEWYEPDSTTGRLAKIALLRETLWALLRARLYDLSPPEEWR